jgi:8-oxo-dGTP pyrophosphatase MutT (NUDIX family)
MYKNTKYLFCTNCGKTGHQNKKCIEPITSLGIILFKIDFENLKKNLNIDIDNNIFNNLSDNTNIIKSNSKNIHNIEKIFIFQKYIKFLLISRRSSLGFIEFMRGNYNENDLNDIVKLFRQMYQCEINIIKTQSFNYLWKYIWQLNIINHNDKDFINSNIKYKKIVTLKFLDYCCNNINPKYNNVEWGFPKGRRLNLEKNCDCAKREFNEETNLNNNDYTILNNISPETENLIGTNNIDYKHIYYFATTDKNIKLTINKNNNLQYKEVGHIGWYNYNETINNIREYHINKKIIINNLYIFICNLILNNK